MFEDEDGVPDGALYVAGMTVPDCEAATALLRAVCAAEAAEAFQVGAWGGGIDPADVYDVGAAAVDGVEIGAVELCR
jgi:hypothetical protein